MTHPLARQTGSRRSDSLGHRRPAEPVQHQATSDSPGAFQARQEGTSLPSCRRWTVSRSRHRRIVLWQFSSDTWIASAMQRIALKASGWLPPSLMVRVCFLASHACLPYRNYIKRHNACAQVQGLPKRKNTWHRAKPRTALSGHVRSSNMEYLSSKSLLTRNTLFFSEKRSIE